jgi:putative oxidoreductase
MSTSTTTAPRVTTLVSSLGDRLVSVLSRHSINVLRVSLGLVFLGFGLLKFVPGLSPAEPLVVRTLDTLSFGLVPPAAALLITAVMETFIGLTLVTGRWLLAGLLVLAAAMGGIMSPLVLFTADLFAGGPTIEAQYVLKDIVLVAAGLVVAAKALGARLVVADRR